MPLASRSRLVLVEIAAAAALIAVAFKGLWFPVGIAVAVLCAALALLSVQRRPLHEVIGSWLSMRLRRTGGARDAAQRRDQFRVVTVPSVGRGAEVGAIQGETTWSVPLELPLSSLINADASIDLDRMAALLEIEGVPLANVRVVTVSWPAMPAEEALVATTMRPAQRATRHLVLTLDTAYAAAAIVERGGPAAIHQILRRCVLRAEELLHATGVEVNRLAERDVAAAAASAVGRTVSGPDVSLQAVGESMGRVDLSDGAAHTFAVSGPDVLARLGELAQLVPAPVVATSVVLRRDDTTRTPMVTTLIRVSGAADVAASASDRLGAAAASLGLRVSPVLGAQLPLFQATTLLGLGRERAA